MGNIKLILLNTVSSTMTTKITFVPVEDKRPSKPLIVLDKSPPIEIKSVRMTGSRGNNQKYSFQDDSKISPDVDNKKCQSGMTVNSPEFVPGLNPRLSPTSSSISSSDGMSIGSDSIDHLDNHTLSRSSSDGLLPRNNFHKYQPPVANYSPEIIRICNKVNCILTKFCTRGRLEDLDSKLLREMMSEVRMCEMYRYGLSGISINLTSSEHRSEHEPIYEVRMLHGNKVLYRIK